MISTPPSNTAPQQQRRSKRNRAWLWALLAFAVLSFCGMAAFVLAVSGGQLPDLGQGPSWTPPAPGAEGPAQAERQPAAALAVGDLAVNASAGEVRLRRTPGFQNKPADDVITTVPAGAQGEVIDGPQAADGLQWWLVRFGGKEGWMAERSSQGILLLDRAG